MSPEPRAVRPPRATRRQFLAAAARGTAFGVGLGVGGALLPGAARTVRAALDEAGGAKGAGAGATGAAELAPEELAADEAFWAKIRKAWRLSDDFTNLESGYYTPAPEPVLEARIAGIRGINRTPSFYMRRRQNDDRERVRARLAELAGCPADEIAITRNTTESLNVVLQGLELSRGDEVLHAEREYPSMKEALEQRAARFGISVRTIEIPRVPASPDEVVERYARAIGPKTRAILVSRMVYLNGQILPVPAIADVARSKGIDVIVDGAHSFAHLDERVPDVGGIAFGASLHKWLGAPLGLGILHVRGDAIERVWPLFGDTGRDRDDIRKFEHQGTQPVASILGLEAAIHFHRELGGARKEARLRHLKDTWVAGVADHPRIRIRTPRTAAQSCAIACVSIAGLEPGALADRLFDEHRVFTVAVSDGVRVAPNLFTGPEDFEKLVRALRAIAG